MQDTLQNSRLNEVLAAAKNLARRHRHDGFGPAHLLFALMDKNTGIPEMLNAWGKDGDYFIDWAEMRFSNFPKADIANDFPTADKAATNVLEEAEKVRLRLGFDEIDPLCLFMAIITPGIAYSDSQIKTLPINDKEMYTLLGKQSFRKKSPSSLLENAPSLVIPFCENWWEEAIVKQGSMTVGREKETRMIMEVLNRHHNSGVLIIGEAGVGKTAILKSFIYYLNENADQHWFDEGMVFKLETAQLLAGCSNSGELESRFGGVIDHLKKLDLPVLIIDDLHALIEYNGGNNNLAYLLNASLADGKFSLVATTNVEEFTKRIEPKETLLRKLELIKIQEPDSETTIKCLEVHRVSLENHHEILIADEALKEATQLAYRYFKDRNLPDAAINLLDRTLSAVRQANAHSLSEINDLTEQLAALDVLISKPEKQAETLRSLRWLNTMLNNKISPVLLGQVENETQIENLQTVSELSGFLTDILTELRDLSAEKTEKIAAVEIAAMVAHQTGIPMGKIKAQEKEKLLNMEQHLRRRVVGQDQAIRTLSDAIVESRSGLNSQGQPIGSFFFLGPTGTGKTELAKTLAEFLFDDERSIIRFDMSEFKEEHSAALLYGAPPGYVGYEEGGLLVNKIRQQPYSVVLFDEIEKAHPSVYDIFLQIMDEGHVHDRLGKKGSFTDAIVIFTSNIGSEWIAKQFEQGKTPESNQLIEIMAQKFRPEFLGRLTEVVPFAPISKSVVVKIFDIQLGKLRKMLDDKGITLKISAAAREFLAQSGYSDRYGARPIANVIRNQIRRPISKMLVSETLQKEMTLHLDIDEQQKVVWTYAK